MPKHPSTAYAMQLLKRLCAMEPDRHPGSAGNRAATDMVQSHMEAQGWTVVSPEFKCIDWEAGSAELHAGEMEYTVLPGPYSLPCDISAPLIAASTPEELELIDVSGKILLLHGDIAREQLMPKNFVFYNPVHHQRIYEAIEQQHPEAVIAATERNPELAGSAYPFPLFEDGDFDIPNAYMKDVDGNALLPHLGEMVHLRFTSRRIPAVGCNVIATKRGTSAKHVVVSAHIDAKRGTPGACDDGSGVVIQMLLAEMLRNTELPVTVELAVLNGEDYYSAPGQMLYMQDQDWSGMLLNINIDGVGPKGSGSAYSLHACPDAVRGKIDSAAGKHAAVVPGSAWQQGDHMIFVMNGVPAMAITSEDMETVWTEIAHTAADNPSIIDARNMITVASFVQDVILSLPAG